MNLKRTVVVTLFFLPFSCGTPQKENLTESAEKNLRATKTETDASIHKYYGEKNRL